MSLLFIFACSGPGSLAHIAKNVFIAQFCAAVGAVVTLALLYDCLRCRRWGFSIWVAGLLLLVHPAWTIDAYAGDCGYLTLYASFAATGVYGFLLLRQYVATNVA